MAKHKYSYYCMDYFDENKYYYYDHDYYYDSSSLDNRHKLIYNLLYNEDIILPTLPIVYDDEPHNGSDEIESVIDTTVKDINKDLLGYLLDKIKYRDINNGLYFLDCYDYDSQSSLRKMIRQTGINLLLHTIKYVPLNREKLSYCHIWKMVGDIIMECSVLSDKKINISKNITMIGTISGIILSIDAICSSDKINKVFCNVGEHYICSNIFSAKYAMKKYDNIVKKVLIFNWISSGTSYIEISNNIPDIMNVSFSINNEVKASDDFSNFLDKAYAFSPDLLVICVDPYSEMFCNYYKITKNLMLLADKCSNGRVISIFNKSKNNRCSYDSLFVHISTMMCY